MFHTFPQLSELRFYCLGAVPRNNFCSWTYTEIALGTPSGCLPAAHSRSLPPHTPMCNLCSSDRQEHTEQERTRVEASSASNPSLSPSQGLRAASLQRKPLGGTGISWSQTTSKILNLGLDEAAEPCKSWTVTQGPFPPSFKLCPPP